MTQLRTTKKFKIETNFKVLKEKFTIDIVLAVIIAIGLFALALYLKSIIGDAIFSEVEWKFRYTTINSYGKSVSWYFELYNDSEYYYEEYLRAFRYNRWNPYLRYDGPPLDYYVYGPMFIYGLWFISLFVGLFNPSFDRTTLMKASVKWTAITFDALTIAMLYIMIIELKIFKGRRIAKHIFGIMGSFALIFSPMNLMYIDAYYLNIPQMTFFTMLSIFLFMKKKYGFSACMLTIAWLSKQMPLFLIIPLFFILSKKENVSFALKKFILPFVVSSFLISIPWIFISPHLYIIRIFGAGRPLWNLYIDNRGIQYGVTLAHSLLYLKMKPIAYFYFGINFPMIPFLFFYVLSILVSHFNAKKINSDETYFFVYLTWLIILTHAFISRGLFKYYDAFFSPFLIITALLLLEKTIQIYNEEKNSDISGEKIENEIEKRKIDLDYRPVLLDIVLTVTFQSSIILIFYYEWIIMISVRYLHPLLLVVMFLILSAFFPISFYKSIFVSENYIQFEKDVIEVFEKTKEVLVNIKDKIINPRRKEST